MALSNRSRDFTEVTLNHIRENLKTPTEPYRELTNWWRNYGEAFDYADPTPEISSLENYMCEYREFMGLTAPNALNTIVTNVSQAQATFVTQSNDIKDLLTDYGKALDVLIETIGDKNFATNFNKIALLEKVNLASPKLAAQRQRKDDFTLHTMAQYGFDKDTAEIMWKLWQSINDSFGKKDDAYIAWYYNRILGSFYYDGFDWNGTAGRAPWVFSNDFFLVEKCPFEILGLTAEEYKKLRDEVLIQHFMLEVDPTPDTYLDFFNEKDKLKTYTKMKNYFEALKGKTLSKDEVKKLFNEYFNKYRSEPYADFAHQSITTAAILADSVNVRPLIEGTAAGIYTGWRHSEMAGWLGDATIVKNGETFFGNDDYLADLDAENIVHYMDKYKLSYVNASVRYYNDINIGSTNTRASVFNEHTSTEYVECLIISELASGGKSIQEIEELTEEARRTMIEKDIRTTYPETYRFLQSLWLNSNEMVA